MENSIKGPDPPPPLLLWKKNIFFFLKLDHFLRTFCKKCISPLKIQKNLENFSKMIKLLLDKQIFATSDAGFSTTCAMTAATRKLSSTTREILAWT